MQNDLKSTKASVEIVSEALLVGQVQANFDSVVEKTGGLSSDLAHVLPGMRVILVERIPLKDTLNEALGAYLSAHAKEKKDIWAAREFTLEAGRKYQPVNVAVWDSGVDLAIFKDRVLKDSGANRRFWLTISRAVKPLAVCTRSTPHRRAALRKPRRN